MWMYKEIDFYIQLNKKVITFENLINFQTALCTNEIKISFKYFSI